MPWMSCQELVRNPAITRFDVSAEVSKVVDPEPSICLRSNIRCGGLLKIDGCSATLLDQAIGRPTRDLRNAEARGLSGAAYRGGTSPPDDPAETLRPPARITVRALASIEPS